MQTLEDILIAANSTLDLSAALPTGTELGLRANFGNQAVWDASATGQFSEFKREFLYGISTMATIPLPSNFRELQQNPMLFDGVNWNEYPEIDVSEKYDRAPGDRYSYVMGDPAEGYNLILNAPIAGATLSAIYQRFPSGLATLADKCELSDPTFVVRKIESYVLYARGDDKFPTAESRAQQTLLNMTGREMKGAGGQTRTTKSLTRNPLG